MATERIQRDLIDHDDLCTQMRECIDDDLVAEYASAMRKGQRFHPIHIMPQEGGRFLVIDGHHRIRAHYKAKPKAKNIDAVVIPVPSGDSPRRAAIEAALKVNVTHGKRLTNADKRNKCRKVWRLDADNWQLSDREIGKIASVDHKTAGSVRKELVKERKLPIREAEMFGQLKPNWLPISYISEQNIAEDFEYAEQREVYGLAQKIEPICRGDADAWSWREDEEDGEPGAIIHRGIEPGKTHRVPLKENYALLRGHLPVMQVIHELDGDGGEKERKEAVAALNASGMASYRDIARELSEGTMGDQYKEALRTLLEEPREYGTEIDPEDSDF